MGEVGVTGTYVPHRFRMLDREGNELGIAKTLQEALDTPGCYNIKPFIKVTTKTVTGKSFYWETLLDRKDNPN